MDGRHVSSPYKLHFLAAPVCKPPFTHLLLMNDIFSHKNAIFRIKWYKHYFDHNIQLRGTPGALMYQFFWKSINLKVSYLTAPLSQWLFNSLIQICVRVRVRLILRVKARAEARARARALHLKYVQPSQWRHNKRDGFCNHRRLDCLFNCSGADRQPANNIFNVVPHVAIMTTDGTANDDKSTIFQHWCR